MTPSEVLEKSAQEYVDKSNLHMMKGLIGDERRVALLIYHAIMAASIIAKNLEQVDP